MIYTVLLIVHGLVGVALLGAITHQAVSMFRARPARGTSFFDRYTGVSQRTFTIAVAVLYLANIVLGTLIYPKYRLDVRVPFEEMSLAWAVGLFELKEHFAGIGFGALLAYLVSWRMDAAKEYASLRIGLTLLLLFIVWWDFLAGHVLNNIRGFA